MQEKIEKLQEIATYLKDDASREQLIRIGQSLENKTFLLTVMGQFSAGKSRLLNNLLGREALPVHITETTALVTLIRYGEQERVEALHKDGTLEELPLEKSLELWQGGGRDLSEIEQIMMYVNSPLLQNGLILADTPGVNTIIHTHEQLTEEIITRSDRVLYVMGKSMTETDQAFVKSVLASGVRVFFARTHMDVLKETEEDASRAQAIEREELSKLTEDEVFFLSNDPENQAYEGVEKLRSYLTAQLSTRLEEAIVENAAARLDFIAQQLSRDLFERRANLSKLLSNDNSAYQEARAETEAELEKMEAILKKNQEGLRKKYLGLRQTAQEELGEATKAAFKTAERKIEALNLGTDSQNYLSAVEAIVRSGCFAIQDAYLSHFDRMLAANRAELETALSGFEGFADLSAQIPENLEASSEQMQEVTDRMRALQSIQEQINGRLGELEAEQQSGQRDVKQLNLEMEELRAVQENVRQQLSDYPPYVAKMITEEGTHEHENTWRTVGKIADIATILIPGEAWVNIGSKVFKGLKVADTAAKTAKCIDTVVDATRLLHSTKRDPIGTARRRVEETDPSLLDYLSIEHWFAQWGKRMDPPAVTYEDQDYRRQYEQEKAKLLKNAEETAKQEAEKRAKLLDIRDEQKKRELERTILQKKRQNAEEELARQERELKAVADKATIRAIHAAYADLAQNRLNDFSEYVRKDVADRTDRAVEGYLGTYDFRISARIQKKRSELEELETKFQNGGRETLAQELALCTGFAAFLDGKQETAQA